nr:hypothetical protein [Tanacetum cinerariifolium]
GLGAACAATWPVPAPVARRWHLGARVGAARRAAGARGRVRLARARTAAGPGLGNSAFRRFHTVASGPARAAERRPGACESSFVCSTLPPE